MNFFKRKKKKERIYNNPWEKYYEEGKETIDIPDIYIYEYFERKYINHEYSIAINYFNQKMTYRELVNRIDLCAKSLVSYGVRENDVVSICLPNVPEAVIAFYAINKVGAIANMIHPLSAELEIKDTLIKTNTVLFITLNVTFDKVENIIDETKIYKTIIVSPKDSMPTFLGLGYMLTKELSLNIPKSNEKYMLWNDFILKGEKYNKNIKKERNINDDAVILHSGGTTGIPKNIVLTNGNINAIMEEARICFPNLDTKDTFLSILPLFHCLGLVVNVLAPLSFGSTIVLVPQFDPKRFDKLIKKYRPTVLLGVPTLFEALIKNPYMINYDMSYVNTVVSGGDSLSIEKNEEINNFLMKHNCSARIMQGYGMTETTGPASIGFNNSDKLGSIGIPLPSTIIKILNIETMEEMKYGEIGEICITGPTVMSRYLDNKKETDNIIKIHEDGKRWVHTGDLGYLDEDGVLFYVQRMKRMIITSGYNVYPSHIEKILEEHEYVDSCGVIGIPDPYKIEVPKAFIVLKKGIEATPETTKILKEYCYKNLSKYMIPKKFEYRESLPKTLVGKIDYRKLEK